MYELIHSANEASKTLEQGLVQNKFAVGKPRAMGLTTGFANVLCNTLYFTPVHRLYRLSIWGEIKLYLSGCYEVTDVSRQIGFHPQRKCIRYAPVCNTCSQSQTQSLAM